MQVKTIYIMSTKDMENWSLMNEEEGIELYTCGLFETKEESSAIIKGYGKGVVSIKIRRYIFVDKLDILTE